MAIVTKEGLWANGFVELAQRFSRAYRGIGEWMACPHDAHVSRCGLREGRTFGGWRRSLLGLGGTLGALAAAPAVVTPETARAVLFLTR